MADIILRSYQTILGQMAAKVLAESDLTDLNPGSVLLTILEAAAASDFTQEGKLLQLMNVKNVDKATGTDLERLAQELGLTPARLGAATARVKITVEDPAFSKISTAVFAGAVSPAAGDSEIKVVDASAFAASGTVYIGRGTSTAESASYSSKINAGSYWRLVLSSPLIKDHLVNEDVVLAQGGDRTLTKGATVRVPASAGNPAVEFETLADATLLDGEAVLSGIECVASEPGSSGNVSSGRIIEFASPPAWSPIVTNDDPSSGGTDAETDVELRQRIKSWVHELGRGTQTAIIRAVVGVNDPDEGKRVVTAFLREPTETGALGILFIDDGTGFQPSFAGVGEETIVTSANGTEQFFQLQQYPVVKAQAVSIGQEPFALFGGEKLLVEVDGTSEEKSIPGTNYRSLGVVTAQEISEAINKTFTTVEARAKDGRLFISPLADDPDYIRIGAASIDDSNDVIRFPTRKNYTIRLYKNNVLLQKNGSEAIIQTYPNSAWPPFGSSETLQLKIDGINSPLITFADIDFATLTSSTTILSATAADWVTVFNSKFIGVTASAQDDGSFIISSNRGRSAQASVLVLGGSLAGTLISDTASAVGVSPQFKLNRLLGQIELAEVLSEDDELKAGTVLTAGFVETPAQSIFDFSATLGTAAKAVFVTDAEVSILAVSQVASPLTFSSPSSGIQRIAGAVGQFGLVNADDYVHTYNLPRSALLKVQSVAANGSYVDCFDPSPGAGVDTPNLTTKQIVFFRTTGVPQEVTFPISAVLPAATMVSTINSGVSGIFAEILGNGKVRISTLRLDGDGGLGVPVLAGTAKNLGFDAGNYPSNDPHIASVESGDLAGLPSQRLLVSVNDLTSPFDAYQVSGTPFAVSNHNRPILHYLGASAKIIRQPLERLSTSSLTFRNRVPYQIVGLGPDLKSASTSGCEFGESDNMVFIVDNDASKKTFDIPMYVEGEIAAPSVPTTTQFDVVDSVGDLLGVSSRWLGHQFEDYRVWFKSRIDLPWSVANTKIRATATQFGPNGKNINVGIFYPLNPSTSPSVAYSIDSTNNKILINVGLESGAERVIGLSPSVYVYFTSTGAGPYTYRIQFLSPVTLSTVLVGDVISLLDPSFNAANLGQYKVTSISNLSDSTRTYEHKNETAASVTVSGSTSVTLLSSPTYAMRSGDKVTFNSITKPALSIGQAEVSTAAFSSVGSFYNVAGVAKAIQLYDNNNVGHYFYFRCTDGLNLGTTDPGLVGTGHVVNLLLADSAATVATKFAAAVDLLVEFLAPAPGGTTVTITNASNGGPVTDITETGSAAIVSVLTQGEYQISVAPGGNYIVGGGTLDINGNPYTYTAYNAGTGVFTGVSPDPSVIVSVSDPVKQYLASPVVRFVNTVSTPTTFTLTSGTSNSDGYDVTIDHKALTASLAPSFVVAVGDKIQVAGQILSVTGVVSATEYDVDTPFTFSGSSPGTVSRIYLECSNTSAGVNQSIFTASAQAVRVFELSASNTAASLVTAINSTAGIQDLIVASNGTGSSGAGIINKSTKDELLTGDTRVALLNGESFVYSTSSASPGIRIKVAADVAPDLGEKVRLIPMTPKNIADHFSKKQISGLSIAANVSLVDGSRKVQVSSKTTGGVGQVYAVGGKASGQNVIAIRETGQEISSSIGVVQSDRSALDLLAPGHTIKMYQTGRAKKSYLATPTALTTVQIQIYSAGVAKLTLSDPLASILSYTHTGSVTWVVRKISKNRVRFEVFSGIASLPATLKMDDWVLVGNGSSYAGTTPAQVFASANQGYFQIRETDASTYFDVETAGYDEFVTTSSAPFVFFPYNSVQIGDQISIANTAPLVSANQGTFVVTGVLSATEVIFANSAVVSEGPFALGSGGVDSIKVLDQGYSTYRKVKLVSPNVIDPTNKATVIVEPGYGISLFNELQGSKISLPNRLGFDSDPVPGISGYQYWTGLKQRVQRTLDGYAPDSATFPGVRAAGVAIEAREPQIQRVTLAIKVKTKEGVALSSISDGIKSSVIGYVNSLGLGQDVILSEVVKLIQNSSGVEAVVLVLPALDQERIVIGDNAIARTSSSEVTIS